MNSGTVINMNDKMNEFLNWIAEEYERVYLIDLENGEYALTYFNDDNHTAPLKGDYATSFSALVRSHVDKDYFDDFISMFALENLRKIYSENKNARLSLRYMGNSDVGRHSWKQINAKSYVGFEDNKLYVVCLIKDTSDEINYETVCTQNALLKSEIEHRKQLDAQNERFEIIVKQTDADVVEWNKQGGYVHISDRLSDIFYISPDSNGLFSNIIHPDDAKAYKQFFKGIMDNTPFSEIVCRAMKKDGNYVWIKICSSNFYNKEGKIVRIVSTVQDVDDQIKAYADLDYRANHDDLTGLENKEKFYISAEKYMNKDSYAEYAVIMLDIDKFRVINDVYGMEVGDDVLCHVAEALKRNITDGCICRMYSDNFAILVKYTSQAQINTTMEKIEEAIKRYPLDINIIISYGVYKVEDTDIPVSVMCDWAGYAKKAVKGNALKTGAFYDETLRENMLEDKFIESEMEQALLNEQFRLYLQPKIDIITSKVIGAEALVRWIHPTKGIIPPARFIPLFEKNSFIIRMDIYIWEQVCKAIRRWIDEGKTPVPISINVSRLHIVDPTLKNTLVSLTDKYDIPHELLEIEITETAFMDNTDTIQRCILELKELGFTVSIDDFGSGYSSLNMLKEVSVDTLKIDRAFLKEVVNTSKGKIIISHTIAMANELNLNVVSEGVETVEQAEFLVKNGCRAAQGFLYSKPLSVQNYEMYAYNTKSHTPTSPFHFKNPLRF